MSATIACLCPAEAPLPLLKESVRCFLGQRHEPRELLLGVRPGSPREAAVLRFLAATEPASVRAVAAATLAELGAEADADLLCAWSSRASSHPVRLQAQLEALEREGAAACVLADRLAHLPETRTAYWLGGDAPAEAPNALSGGLLSRRAEFDACRRSLVTGHWPPRELATRLHGGAGLLIERADAAPAPGECSSLGYARPLLGPLAAAIDAHRVPRPLLLALRGPEGGLKMLDPKLGEEALAA